MSNSNPAEGTPVQDIEKTFGSFVNLGANFKVKLGELTLLLGVMNKNSLARVAKKSNAYPLEDDAIKLIQPDEEKAYELSVALFHMKIEMMFEQARETAEAEMKAAQEKNNGE